MAMNPLPALPKALSKTFRFKPLNFYQFFNAIAGGDGRYCRQ